MSSATAIYPVRFSSAEGKPQVHGYVPESFQPEPAYTPRIGGAAGVVRLGLGRPLYIALHKGILLSGPL